MLTVTDDSGFLALVVPAAYESFVDRDWKFDQILAHFKAQMARRSLLIWGTGLEGMWNVDIVSQLTKTTGVREITGSLSVDGGSLLLTNYESLTMAAQFEDVKLPEKHQQELLVSLPNGDYTCRIVQMFDPEQQDSATGGKADFVVEVWKSSGKIAAWESIPWFRG
jgi:hypothetical protein